MPNYHIDFFKEFKLITLFKLSFKILLFSKKIRIQEIKS